MDSYDWSLEERVDQLLDYLMPNGLWRGSHYINKIVLAELVSTIYESRRNLNRDIKVDNGERTLLPKI